MNHPSTTLAVLFTAYKDADMVEEEIYSSVAELFADFSDERKADLYARLVERIEPGMTFAWTEAAIKDCMLDNEQEFLHG